MKKIILFLNSLFVTLIMFSQDSKLSVTLSYPLTIGDNSLSTFTGIADVGLQARFIGIGPVKLGVSANAGYYRKSNELGSVTIREKIYLIQPRVFGELQLESLISLRPFAGVGYSINLFDITYENAQNPPDYDDSSGGININLGAAYDFSEKFFAHIQFDFLKVSRDNPNLDNNYFRNSNILKLGLGYRF